MTKTFTSEVIKLLQESIQKNGDVPFGIQIYDQEEDCWIWTEDWDHLTLFRRGDKVFLGQCDNGVIDDGNKLNISRSGTNIEDILSDNENEEKERWWEIPLMILLSILLIAGLIYIFNDVFKELS